MLGQSMRFFAVVVVVGLALSVSSTNASDDLTQSQRVSVSNGFAGMPLPFTKNMGQWPDSILFRASANGATMWFTRNGIWYQFFRTVEKPQASATATDSSLAAFDALPGKFSHERDSIETTMIKAEFVGASESVEVVGLEELEYKCNYFIGNDESKWRTDVPNYSAVTMRGLYPGVDVTFSAKDGRLQEKINAPSGNDLAQVKVEYHGAVGVNLQNDNIATIQTSLGGHQFEGALLVDGFDTELERQVASATSSASGVTLVYSTYLGGNNTDVGSGIAVDGAGSAYVTGWTYSADFPTANPFDGSLNGYADAFVTKLSPAGNTLVYSTYLGGTDADGGSCIAIDAGGNAYVTGYTQSANFPIQNPFQASLNGGADAFVTKLNSAGSGIIYSTYLGGSGGGYDEEFVGGIAIDAGGNAYVTGHTTSSDFPTATPFDGSLGGSRDAFVTKLSPAGNTLVYSTYLGGNYSEYGYGGIAIDGAGSAYVTGWTMSSDFPTANPFDSSFNSEEFDVFVTKLSPAGNTLVYSTYLGGSGADHSSDIAVDGDGSAYVTGFTWSSDFPIANAFDSSVNDAFVTKLSPAGNTLVYSTYLGGNGNDEGSGIAVDGAGSAYVTGETNSSDFPTATPYDGTFNGYNDAFVTKLSPAGNTLVYSTYLGGSGNDGGFGIAVDGAGSAYVTGRTSSSDFPTQNPYDGSYNGGGTYNGDAFVTKFGAYETGPHIGLSANALTFTANQNSSLPSIQTLTLSNTGSGTLNWSVSDDSAWLDVNPPTGNSNSAIISVSVNTTNLTSGSYNATITVSSTNADNSPQIISVQYIVSPPPELAVDFYSPYGAQFWAFTGISKDIRVRLSDANSGTGIPGSSGAVVQLAFSNGESALVLRDDGIAPDITANDGNYFGTWSPQTLGPVTMTATATLTGYTSGQDVVSGGVYEPVSATSLRDAASQLANRVAVYLANNPTLAYTIIKTGVDSLSTGSRDLAKEYTKNVSEKIAQGATNASLAFVGDGFIATAKASMIDKVLFEGERWKMSNQLQDLVAALRDQSPVPLSKDAYFYDYALDQSGLTAHQAFDDVYLGIWVPDYVPKGYPIGPATQRLRALCRAFDDATDNGEFPYLLKDRRDARIYWRQPGYCAQEYELYAIGSEIPQARAFYEDLKQLSQMKKFHKDVSRLCKVFSWGKTAVNFVSVISGGTTLGANAVVAGAEITCTVQDYVFTDLEFEKQLKIHDFLSSFGATWPLQLRSGYDLFRDVRGSLQSSFQGDPANLCATIWVPSNPRVCLNFESGSPRLTGEITIRNSDVKSGSAKVVAELSLGKEPTTARFLQTVETPAQTFDPGESKTIPFSIDGVPSEFCRKFSKYFVTIRVLTGGRALEDYVITLDRNVGYVVCNSGQQSMALAGAGSDSTFVLSSGPLAPTAVHEDTLTFPPGAVKATLTLMWPSDSLELHLYDGAGRHVGLNNLTGTIDSLIPGLTRCNFTSGLSSITLSGLTDGPYRAQAKSLSTDTTNYSISVYTESGHPPLLNLPSSLTISCIQGDSTVIAFTLVESGGQYPVTNTSVHMSDLISTNDSIATEGISLGSFPLAVPADSSVLVEAEFIVPRDKDTGAYVGTIEVTSDLEIRQIPVTLRVRAPHLRGDLDYTGSLDIADLTALIDYLYLGGLAPYPLQIADMTCDNNADIADLTALIDYLYISFTPPAVCQ